MFYLTTLYHLTLHQRTVVTAIVGLDTSWVQDPKLWFLWNKHNAQSQKQIFETRRLSGLKKVAFFTRCTRLDRPNERWSKVLAEGANKRLLNSVPIVDTKERSTPRLQKINPRKTKNKSTYNPKRGGNPHMTEESQKRIKIHTWREVLRSKQNPHMFRGIEVVCIEIHTWGAAKSTHEISKLIWKGNLHMTVSRRSTHYVKEQKPRQSTHKGKTSYPRRFFLRCVRRRAAIILLL